MRRSFRGYDGQQQVRSLVPSGIERGLRAGVVVGVEMREVLRADAVRGRYVEPDLVALAENHRGRPDLDLAFHRLAGLEPPALVVRVVGAVRQRLLLVELAV